MDVKGMSTLDIEEIAVKLQETTDKAARNEGRIKKLERESEALHKLATSVEVMAEQMKNINTNVSTLTKKVDDIESKPGKRWDSLVGNIIWGIVGAVLAYLLSQIGLH
jgi:predicted  nucleic acid-binding Zn-ribbon protein